MKNGRGKRATAQHIPTDKSTEPLVLSMNMNSNMMGVGDTSSGTTIFANGGDGIAVTPIQLPLSPLNLDSLPPPPTIAQQQAEGHMSSDEEDGSGTGGVTPTPRRLVPAAIGRATAFPTRASQVLQHFGVSMNENVRQNRQLAQKEYEWLATVLERCFFIVFVTIFIVLTGGINFIGYMHWSNVEGVIYENPETIVD